MRALLAKLQKVKCVYEPRTHQTRAQPGFLSMKRLGVFQLTLPGWDASPSQVYPQRRRPFITWVERRTVRVKCLAQQHNTMSPPRARSGLERTNHQATAPAETAAKSVRSHEKPSMRRKLNNCHAPSLSTGNEACHSSLLTLYYCLACFRFKLGLKTLRKLKQISR